MLKHQGLAVDTCIAFALLSWLAYESGVYARLVLAGGCEKELEIVRDLPRTYPTHIYYQQRQGPGQRSLFNVLRAYAVYDPQVRQVLGIGLRSRATSSCEQHVGALQTCARAVSKILELYFLYLEEIKRTAFLMVIIKCLSGPKIP